MYDNQESHQLHIDMDGAPAAKGKGVERNPFLSNITEDNEKSLMEYLRGRLNSGISKANARANRYTKIDRLISTWQQLDKNDSKREEMEENTGRNAAIPFNLPILATHLQDMVSYYAESLAPISNPFVTSDGNEKLTKLTASLNKDALARDYYGELVLTLRSLLKYNLGGMTVEWDKGNTESIGLTGLRMTGNQWKSIDMYNVMWDTTITNPREIPFRAEWGSVTRQTNRIEMARRSVSGDWVNLNAILNQKTRSTGGSGTGDSTLLGKIPLWRNPADAVPDQGEDSRTSAAGVEQAGDINWAEFGLGTNTSTDSNSYELTTMYCWIVPSEFGLLGPEAEASLNDAGVDSDVHLELWRFEIIDGQIMVSASPVLDRSLQLQSEVVQIPMYLSFMTPDQLAESQRSTMELMRGFQRFSSAMFSIYVDGQRSNVWGIKGVDTSMFDISQVEKGETAAWLTSKIPGRDVRAGLLNLGGNAGVDGTMQAISASQGLKDQMFPSQALPSQVAGMERAVTSQVSTVVQGAQRSMRMTLRTIDSALMLPARMAAVRNTQRFDRDVAESVADVTDEDIAKSLGSGIESMEAERVSEALWRLVITVTQNQEAMQVYDVPAMLSYLGKLMNLSVDLKTFVKQQPEQPAQPEGPPTGEPQPQPQ